MRGRLGAVNAMNKVRDEAEIRRITVTPNSSEATVSFHGKWKQIEWIAALLRTPTGEASSKNKRLSRVSRLNILKPLKYRLNGSRTAQKVVQPGS